MNEYQPVLDFWFEELTAEQHFEKNGAADRGCATRFVDLHRRLSASVPHSWREDENGCLAAIVVLDQFSRNLFRGSAQAFASDHIALDLARHALDRGFDQRHEARKRVFFYMPFEHSEDAADQERSVALFTAMRDEKLIGYAVRHQEVIDRFGRFPHRNKVLGRDSSEEEIAFINTAGTGF